uniref:Swt1 family HEPN domain-containing protein n=1 Tax=Paractinoplanes polyasparticus TaxID=2856853 RepID=UPI001C863747|nr:Swt1 family HEPN domain-containing protein [Actinoplanes polyasparticus]
MNSHEAFKVFGLTTLLIEHDLDEVEALLNIDLGRAGSDRLRHEAPAENDQEYYPQIERDIRAEAAAMAPHYETFYSLEKTIRGLVAQTLEAEDGELWWASSRVPPRIKAECESRRKREIDTGNTPRSDEELDFATFGELSEIIKANWDIFGSLFKSAKAVERVMANLNTLRGPIAHCTRLAEDEVVRLRLAVRDWFRLME